MTKLQPISCFSEYLDKEDYAAIQFFLFLAFLALILV